MQDLLIKQFLPRITFELCWLVLAMVRVCLFRICRCMLDYIFGWIHSFELAGLNGFPLFQITLAWPSFDMYQTRLNWQDQKGFAVIFFILSTSLWSIGPSAVFCWRMFYLVTSYSSKFWSIESVFLGCIGTSPTKLYFRKIAFMCVLLQNISLERLFVAIIYLCIDYDMCGYWVH